jgi:peptidoglycan/LPS O-acetylase OafA/YrhL
LESQGDRAGAVTERFPCFDGFRAIAACMVLLVHASIVTGVVQNVRAGPFLARMDAGVAVFFVISGFLLYRPYVIEHLGGRDALPTRSFWRRRVLRIFPAYWVALFVIAYVLRQRSVPAADAPIYFGLLQVYSPTHVLGGLSQAWSLCTELSYYALLPLYAWVLGRRQTPPARQVWVEWTGLGVLVIISLGFRAFVRAADVSTHVLNWLPAWLDLFAFGMALAVLSATVERTGRPGRLVTAVGRRPALCWLGAVVAFWVVATRLDLPAGIAPVSVVQELGRHYLYGLVGLLIVLPGVFGDQRKGLIRRMLQSRPVVAVGVVSYGVYLWHISMLEKVTPHLRDLGSAEFPVVVVVGLALTYVVARASYVIVEKPALRLKGRDTRTSSV